MQQAIFDKIRRIVYDKSGIHIREGRTSMVAARIAKRIRALQLEDERAYLNHLLSDTIGQEIVELLNVISTNVTHFYREAVHFEFLDQTLSQWARQGQTRFRIWCAASSTGEEPYTIGITLKEAFALAGRQVDARILATDISTNVLAHCRAGRYHADQLNTVPTTLRNRYFQRLSASEGNFYQVRPDLRSMIVFKRLNLNEPPFPMKGPLDVVFCRNVMIYFDRATKTRLLNDIHRLLKPGGYLIISHTENLTDLQDRYKRVGPSIYQKPEDTDQE